MEPWHWSTSSASRSGSRSSSRWPPGPCGAQRRPSEPAGDKTDPASASGAWPGHGGNHGAYRQRYAPMAWDGSNGETWQHGCRGEHAMAMRGLGSGRTDQDAATPQDATPDEALPRPGAVTSGLGTRFVPGTGSNPMRWFFS